MTLVLSFLAIKNISHLPSVDGVDFLAQRGSGERAWSYIASSRRLFLLGAARISLLYVLLPGLKASPFRCGSYTDIPDPFASRIKSENIRSRGWANNNRRAVGARGRRWSNFSEWPDLAMHMYDHSASSCLSFFCSYFFSSILAYFLCISKHSPKLPDSQNIRASRPKNRFEL